MMVMENTIFVNSWFHYIPDSLEQGNYLKIIYLPNYSNKKETYKKKLK